MQEDIGKILGTFAFAAVVGSLLNAILVSLLVASLLLIAWQVYRLHELNQWIDTPSAKTVPHSGGLLYEVLRKLDRKDKKSKQRQRQLSSFLNQIRKAIGALPDAIVLINDSGKIEWANNNSLNMLGVRWPADNGLRFSDLVRYPALQSMLESTDPPEHGVEITSTLIRGSVMNIKCLRYTDDLRMVIARDVTRLVQANQMQRDFVANVSHELKTPLTVLRGYIEILQDQATLPEPLLKPIDQMNLQTLRMELIVNDLLHLARLESSDTAFDEETIDMQHIVSNVLEALQPLIVEKQHDVQLDLTPNLTIEGASKELHSVVSNLLTNAIHYTPKGGNIKISWSLDDGHARLAIKDNGPGIAAHHIDRLTQRFYRVDTNRSRESGGTGLGLAIVKHVLQRHKAELEIKSRLGEGSTFTCDFVLQNDSNIA